MIADRAEQVAHLHSIRVLFLDLSVSEGHVYDQDGLRSIHNHEFMDDPAFRKAYEREKDFTDSAATR